MYNAAVTSKARDKLDEHKGDIERLRVIHEEVVGAGPGRKHDVEVLNRATIVLITACWEAYVEDVCIEGYEHLLKHAKDAEGIPAKMRVRASGALRAAKDERLVWALADNGWRTVLREHWRSEVAALNTPKAANLEDLFHHVLGLKDLASHWSWQGMSASKAARKLDKYVTVRGDIAHRVRHDDAVHKSWTADYLGHILHLADKTDDAVRRHVKSLVGSAPW